MILMKKISVAIDGGFKGLKLEESLELVKRCGFDAVDIGLEFCTLDGPIYGGSQDEMESYFYGIKKKCEDLELTIGQTHGRCETYYPNDDARKEWVHKICEKDFNATALLGAPACVVHFINSTKWGQAPAHYMRYVSNEMFKAIIPSAEKHKVKIALETFGAARVHGARIRDFFADPNEYLWQYNQMDTEYKTMCVDTGHTHEAGSFWVPPADEMIRILGKDVTLLHLHDNSGHWDNHMLPGMGNINWPKVFDALDDIGYKGTYNHELTLHFCGTMLEDYLSFCGKYLRKFIDNHGNMHK